MAIKPHRELPHDLPPARLFLDDIRDVIEIFRGGAKYCAWQADHNSPEPKLSFQARGFACDTLEDLHILGGETTAFKLHFDEARGYSAYLHIARYTLWNTFGLSEEGQSVVYGKLRALFDSRIVRWKAFFHALPSWLFFPIAAALLILSAIPPCKWKYV